MPQVDITKDFKLLKQAAWKDLPDLVQQNMLKYERARTMYLENIFRTEERVLPEMNKISDNIWVGTVLAAVDSVLMRKNGITRILNMALDEEYDDYNDVEDIHVTRIGIYDGHLAPVGVHHRAAEVIKDAVDNKQSILVHCSAGISRSSTAVLSYFILHEGMNFHSALTKMQEARFCISPHPLLVRSIIRDFGDKFVW